MENFEGKFDSLVSIIIPTRELDDYTKRCVRHCERIPEQKEIIVVTDEECPGYPALKRNWAMERAKGSIFAFIDSDAYPTTTWLSAAFKFLNCGYSAVCGPGVLPPDAPPGEIVADTFYRMMPYSYRVVPEAPRWVSEYPTFNLIVKRQYAPIFENYLTGEDSLFCRSIGGVFYHPSIMVFHNRRPAYKKLWKQVGTYGKHRGYLIREAFLAWMSSVVAYALNFFRGLFVRRPS